MIGLLAPIAHHLVSLFSNVVWLSYMTCWMGWFITGASFVWAIPMIYVRYVRALDGHAIVWPPAMRGAPLVVRALAILALAIAGVQIFAEPGIWPPLLGARLGCALSVVGVLVAWALEITARDLLHRAPHAARNAAITTAGLVLYRLLVLVLMRSAKHVDAKELVFPLPLSVTPHLARIAVPLAAALCSAMLFLASRTASRHPLPEATTGPWALDERRYFRMVSSYRSLLFLLTLATSVTHAPESYHAMVRWFGSWDPID